MKTKRLGLFMLCLLFASISSEISAQTHLDALIKKCETHKSVDMEVVKNKRKTDKEVETKTVNIRITNDKNLVNEFLDAFKKDAADAEQAMFRKKKESSEVNYYQCRFSDQIYTITVKDEESANVTTVGNFSKFQFRQFSLDSLSFNRQKQMLEQHKEREEQHKERIQQYQNRIQQYKFKDKERMEQHKERIQQYQNKMQQYKFKNLDSIFSKHNIIVDSLILKSPVHFHSTNWDSITSKFGNDMDSLARKIGVGWDEILERYDLNKK